MTADAQINKAIGAHGLWRSRLLTAISTGRLDTPVATLERDDRCDFGMWLHGPDLDANAHASADYRTVRDLHAEFHKVAAEVAHLAETGKPAEARAMVDHGRYANVSGELTSAMMHWKQHI
jgi:hypothetical protein